MKVHLPPIKYRIGRWSYAIRLLLPVVAVAWSASDAVPQGDPEIIYWVSMRGITEDAGPTFVRVSKSAVEGRTQSFVGCDGKTYFATPTHHAAVQSALSAGETLHLHSGTLVEGPAASTIECLFQADGE